MKKIALFMALLMLVVCLAACGQKQNETGNSAQTTTPADTITSDEMEGTTAATVKICEHKYTETLIQDATCEEDGMLLLTCTLCGEERDSVIPAMGHKGSGASCTEPSLCIVCGMLDEPAWGHVDANGFCRNCGLEMDTLEIPVETTEATQPQE